MIKLYVIDWYVNATIKETLNINKPTSFAVAKWQIKQQGPHPGRMVPRCINIVEVTKWRNEQQRKKTARIIKTGK